MNKKHKDKKKVEKYEKNATKSCHEPTRAK